MSYFPKLHPYQEEILKRIIRGEKLVFVGGQHQARTMTMHICAIAHSIRENRTIPFQTVCSVEQVRKYFEAAGISYTFNPQTNKLEGVYHGHNWSVIIESYGNLNLNKV